MLKIILINDSDVTGFHGYRVSQMPLTPVDYPIIILLWYMYAIAQNVLLFYFGEGHVSKFGRGLILYFHTHTQLIQFSLFLDVEIYFR